MTGHKIIKYIVDLTQEEVKLILEALNRELRSSTDSVKADALVDLEESFSTLLSSPQ